MLGVVIAAALAYFAIKTGVIHLLGVMRIKRRIDSAP
jgi:hypothetical protein